MSEEKCNYYWDGVCRCMDSSINQDFYKEPMCCDVPNCYYKENKRLREALLEIARIEPSPIFSYSSKDIDKICMIAEQALGEQHEQRMERLD